MTTLNEPTSAESTAKRSKADLHVAIVGNPNAGKTSLFNALTGSAQKVGNYPGVTVERASALVTVEGKSVEFTDVPGLYSMNAVSEDEIVAVDAILGRHQGEPIPDVLLCVMDAGNLERNLFFYSQLAEAGIPIVVALTMTDLSAKAGKEIDVVKLANLLDCEVVVVISHKGLGMDTLRAACLRTAESDRRPKLEIGFPLALETRVSAMQERLARAGLDFRKSTIRDELIGRTSTLEDQLVDFADARDALKLAQAEIETEGLRGPTVDLSTRYQWAAVIQRASTLERDASQRKSFTDRIDAILIHRVWGLLIFGAIMYGVFQSIYTLATPLMDLVEAAFSKLGEWVGGPLEANPTVQSLVVDGIINGVGSAVIFLPQIVILFFFIAVLEGTGYLARAAFLMDRLLGWCGLSGRAFIPLLSSFACAIPGIMAARVMPDQKSRLATILVAPLMSCSARLPVYILLIGTFIEPQFGPGWAGFALFAMHLLGLAVAVPVVIIINRGIIKSKRLPFVLELPPYQWPKWRDVWISMLFRAKTFLQTAGTIIVVMSVLIWGLLYFPRSEEANARYAQEYAAKQTTNGISEEQYVMGRQMEESFLGRFGKAIEPVFVPAGFDWRISTAILCAFPAREVVVSSMGIIFNLGDEQGEDSPDLRKAVESAKWPDGRPLFTPWTAVGLMVFFALCCQCMATLATVRRETGSWKWPTFMFVYMTSLAYLFAIGIHQLGLAVGG